jgi:hypothetical protein
MEQLTQTIVAQSNAPLLGTFPYDGQNRAFPIEMAQTQIA